MVILDLVEAVSAVADGAAVEVPLGSADDVALVEAWCAMTGNTLVSVGDQAVVVRRGRAADPVLALPSDRRPGARLWLYTNFDCNLACDYCCVRSSPRAPRRELGLERIRRICAEAPSAGVAEILITGGEPFLLADIGSIVAACADAAPTRLLTNGMLFRGRRLDLLRAMPRDRVTLQISLDSASPALHDAHRGVGSWARAVSGIQTALAEGFVVRVAATVSSVAGADAAELSAYLSGLGIPREDQLIRPLARRGFADEGVVLTVESLLPEVTVTADGVYWHPVGADDDDQLVTRDILPLRDAVELVTDRFRAHRLASDRQAELFPCA
jgi:pyruvate-formate lyase-activating enzyme